jgi:hypothetical protein
MSYCTERPFIDALRGALFELIDVADKYGVTRAKVASSIGVQACTIDSWKNPSTEAVIPAVQLVKLLRRDVVPQAAKVAFVNRLLDVAGVEASIIDGDVEDTSAPLVQLGEISTEMGKLAERLTKASKRDGDGGERMTRTELQAAIEASRGVSMQLGELQRTLHSMMEDCT